MKLLIIILLFALPFVSCKKEGRPLFDGQTCNGSCYILTGRLSEAQSSRPLVNTELRFYYQPTGYSFFDLTKYLGRTTTAADGSYTFRFDGKNFINIAGSFKIEGGIDGYIYNNYGDKTDKVLSRFYLDSSEINIPQINNLRLYKAATLKFRIRAVSITNFEFLTVTYGFGTNGFGPVINGDRSVDTTLIYKTAADIPTFISWDALGNGVNIQRKDTLTVSAGTEKVYQINL